MGADTVDSFPTYADLTQTQGWTRDANAPIVGDSTEVFEDPELQRYKPGELLGTGGMGKVVLARDARIGRDVAVKELHRDRGLAPEDHARFLREARVQGQLEHPSIVPVYDIDERSDGATFFTMRRVLGKTLHSILDDLRRGDPAARARFTQRELLTAFATVCLTIDYAHSRGVVHRDIKPANIMLGDFGEVYVLDWGLALLIGETALRPVDEPNTRLSMTGALLGTPLYMAPEQMADPAVTPAADVYSLGAILFEILTLVRLRDADTMYLPADARPSVRTPDLDVPPELEKICVLATEAEPTDRFPSARALQVAIAAYLEGDRDMQTRRDLAADHARGARDALVHADEPGADYERMRATATNELLKAVALEPTNPAHVATLAEFLQTRPRVLPVDVQKQISANESGIVRTAAGLSAIAMLVWFATVPAILLIGLRDVSVLMWVLVPGAGTLVAALYAYRSPIIPLWAKVGMVAGTLVGAMATSRAYGPLVFTPTLIATFTIVLQAHPITKYRDFVFTFGLLALIVPIVLELAGVLPSSYVFEGGRMTIIPQMMELPQVPTSLFLAITSMAMLLIPGIFIRKLRVSLTQAEEQLMLQAWHLKQITRS